MPKVKLNRKPSDRIKALILERKNAEKLNDEQMAVRMGVSRATWQKRINHQHTDEWPLGQVMKVCKSLGIPIEEVRDATRY